MDLSQEDIDSWLLRRSFVSPCLLSEDCSVSSVSHVWSSLGSSMSWVSWFLLLVCQFVVALTPLNHNIENNEFKLSGRDFLEFNFETVLICGCSIYFYRASRVC
uniref:Uncharacterized protein n=1 Tax=Cacopsylla melanoneura TaxID=428564 RepID=A0A8D9BR93_9HEMI